MLGEAGIDPQLIVALTGLLVAVGGLVFREAGRKDTRVDAVTAGQIQLLVDRVEKAEADETAAYQERDKWQAKYYSEHDVVTRLKAQIRTSGSNADD